MFGSHFDRIYVGFINAHFTAHFTVMCVDKALISLEIEIHRE